MQGCPSENTEVTTQAMTAPQRQRFHQAATRCPARGSIAIEKIMDKFYCPIATSSLAESLPIGRNDAARLRGSRARGRHHTLEIETLHARGPCTRDRNADDEQQQGRVQGTHLPRQEQPNILHDEIPLADAAQDGDLFRTFVATAATNRSSGYTNCSPKSRYDDLFDSERR